MSFDANNSCSAQVSSPFAIQFHKPLSHLFQRTAQSLLEGLSKVYNGVRHRSIPKLIQNMQSGTEVDRVKGVLWTFQLGTFGEYIQFQNLFLLKFFVRWLYAIWFVQFWALLSTWRLTQRILASWYHSAFLKGIFQCQLHSEVNEAFIFLLGANTSISELCARASSCTLW